jgi:hypothetical protein
VGKVEVDPRGPWIIRISDINAGRQHGRGDVAVGVEAAMRAVVSALGESLGDTRPAQAVLAERGGVGAGAMEPPSGGFAFAFERGHQHAGTEQSNPLAPQPRPGRDPAVLHGDHIVVGSHDPRRHLAGAGLFGQTGRTGLAGMVGTCW